MFDPCQHKLTLIVLRAGALIRSLRGLEPENNITSLYNETAPMLGLVAVQINSSVADHLPRPEEMKNEKGEFSVPNKACPKCGKVTFLNWICQSCEQAEGGKYKTGYTCETRSGGCGFIDEKTGEFLSQRLTRMGREVPEGMKADLGIKTLTDDGLK